MSFGGGSSAPAVPAPTPAPTVDTAQVVEAKNREKQKRILQRGRASTILTQAANRQPKTVASNELLGG